MNAIEAEGLELRYGSTTVLTSSSFTAPSGRITALVGPNGAGKSTILHCIVGLISPTAGRIAVLGTSPQKARRQVAYVIQTNQVNHTLPLTVYQVVAMGRYPSLGMMRTMKAVDRSRVSRAMERMAITDLANRHLTELSGGQRQRVFMAQGLAQDHSVLLLDEPLAGLDIVSTEAVYRFIHDEQAHGCAVLLATHDLEEAWAADHVLLLGGNRVISGPPQEVLTEENLVRVFGLGLLRKLMREAIADLGEDGELVSQLKQELSRRVGR